ncbi:4,5-DOPA dioxygenase extradiol [Arenimonas sp. GDDSR-1]|uniref:4,5-DOPA-extradiol-dioxygenase n=1 Tax=Arenimonas sp. GDDSR-1 TaxID=2950125 RepID=UPI002614AC9B|nr:4,5-DOPA dioxygenase extradiol [Arenimonas sp. GDDSR-1]
MSLSRMPAVFIGHGSPMNAITDNPFRRAWAALGRELPKPRAVLCISAHWETPSPRVCAVAQPETIHDFGGFPAELFAVRYPAPGSPALAQQVAALSAGTVEPDLRWGLDHGAWQVLMHLFPQADVPVAQLSLPRAYTPRQHADLARSLAPLRDEGIMVIGSGNIVHNLRLLAPGGVTPEWASDFDAAVADAIEQRDLEALADYRNFPGAAQAVPTPEHYWPLLYVMAMAAPDEPLQMFNTAYDWGSISMRSLRVG